jgi:hypothetical protein
MFDFLDEFEADRRCPSCGSSFNEADALIRIPISADFGVLRLSVARCREEKRVAHYPSSPLLLCTN